MKLSINKVLVLVMMIIFSCGQKPIMEGFDSKAWQADKGGCNNLRITLANDIIERKAELKGLNQNEITAVFGKADRHELYSRNKKAFVYFIEGGPDCLEKIEIPGKLVIRFDGIGRAKEIILYKN